LIVQYTEGTQYIDEPHANGFLGDATLEKVPTTLTTDLDPVPVKFCGNSYGNSVSISVAFSNLSSFIGICNSDFGSSSVFIGI
jgi:hypothetical protein